MCVVFSILFALWVVIVSSQFLGLEEGVGWWGFIWACVVGTVAVVSGCYKSIGISDCSFGGVFCCDEISCWLIWLSVLVSGLSLLGGLSILAEKSSGQVFIEMVVGLMVSLVVCFATDSLFVFYIFFEVSLVPTFYIICGWGYQPERLQAVKYIVLYTVTASLPLLVYVVYIFSVSGSSSFVFFYSGEMGGSGLVTFLMSSMAFLVKCPMYGVHLWLPKAHVEAPVTGSMLLAGVLLKLGGYGLVRFSWFWELSSGVCGVVVCLSLFGGVIASVACCMQVDVKSLIAYSSIGHMSLVIGGLMSGSCCGLVGSIILMLSHGLSSCGMFFLAGNLYKLFGSRMLFVIRGGVGSLCGVSIWLALMCGFNAGVPLSLGFCGEVVLYVSLVSYSLLIGAFVGVLSLLSCFYSWFFYCWTQVGSYPLWVCPSRSVSDFYVDSVVCWCIVFHLVGLCFFCLSKLISF